MKCSKLYNSFLLILYRQNLCGITRSSYLRVLLSLVEACESYLLLNESLLSQLREVVTDCNQAIQTCCFKQLFDKDLAILQLKLLLWCSSHHKLAGLVFGGTNLEPTGLLRQCLDDGYPLTIRTFCLEFVNKTNTFSVDVIANCVLNSLCSEVDPDYLIQV